MSCCGTWVGGWVGGWVSGTDRRRLAHSVSTILQELVSWYGKEEEEEEEEEEGFRGEKEEEEEEEEEEGVSRSASCMRSLRASSWEERRRRCWRVA